MSKTPSRIYRVDNIQQSAGDNSKPRLVRAISATQAVRHVADHYTADVASQDDLVRLVADGVGVENAGADKVAALVEPQGGAE